MKTHFETNQTAQNNWCLVDASGQVLGRLAAQISKQLRGKHKPCYTPHVDTGDYVIVINASKIKVTGKKAKDKIYYRHTEFPDGLKEESFEKLHGRRPERVIELAVKGMLPKNPLGRFMYKKLKVYAGAEHPHTAQQPVLVTLTK